MNQAWMLPEEVFGWIDENVPKGSIILEFGSGHGSIRLSHNYSVTSVEHDEEWLNIAAVNYVHAPIIKNSYSTEVGERGWYDISIVKENLPPKIDLVIIDGPPGIIGRTGILSILESLLISSWIILDDVDREPESKLCKSLETIINRDSIKYSCKIPRKDGSIRSFSVFNLGEV